MADLIRFTPIRATEDYIRGTEKYTENGENVNNGKLWFATDTGHIFLDTVDGRTVMGGSGVSIIYGHGTPTTEGEGENKYSFTFSDFDADATYRVNDLILNSDGCFYRIDAINEEYEVVDCTRLAVSGSGGGGGGGDDPTPSAEKIKCSVTPLSSYSNWIYGQSKKIYATVTSPKDTSVSISFTVANSYADTSSTRTYGPYSSANTSIVEAKWEETGNHEWTCTFDLGAVLPLGTNNITIYASGDEGGEVTKTYKSIQAIVMELRESTSFNPMAAYSGAINFSCIPIGENIYKNLTVYVDGETNDNLKKTNIITSGKAESITIPALPHGTHTIRAVLSDTSNLVNIELNYQIACVDTTLGAAGAPIIWMKPIGSSIVDHSKLIINYSVYDPKDTAHAEVHYYLNGEELPVGMVAYDSSSWQTWRVVGYKLGMNTISIVCGATSMTCNIEVLEDTERDLNIVGGYRYAYSTEGRSNKENISARTTWLAETDDSSVTPRPVEFNNFNWYNNGWITDDDDNVCLRISNGASIKIPLNDVLKADRLGGSLSFELMFKLRNIKTYKTLIETVVENEDSDNPIVKKNIISDEGVAIRYYDNHVGFCIGTQETFFTSSNTTVSGRIKEDELIHLSFVVEAPDVSVHPLIYIYINGIASGIAKYDAATDKFYATNANFIEINSDFCDVDLYRVRIYNTNLRARDVVQNYIADYADPDMYDVNMNIVEYNDNIPTIDYTKMVEYNKKHPENLLMPYAVITTLDKEHTLPYKKADSGWTVNIDFTNPYLDYLWEHNELDTETAKAEWKYIKGCPSYHAEGVDLNVQGTSSQGYPRRNYKAKFKKAMVWNYTNGPLAGKSLLEKNKLSNGDTVGKKWYMDSDIPANKFTWKADYMDSSRTHNSGFASFVRTMYTKHPIQDYGVTAAEADKYRTSVYGFPMMVFHNKGTAANPVYEFIGLYNYNLDKGCDDNFGFCDFEQDSKIPNGAGGYKPFSEAAECWELCNNQGSRCSFKKADFEEVDEKGALTVLNDFEVRYHADADNIENAIHGDHKNDKADDFSAVPQAERNAYILNRMKNLEDLVKWLVSVDAEAATGQPLETPYVVNETTSYTTDTAEYRLAKFTKEFKDHFDEEYCTVYYIMTELLLCYDSRGKNLMLATWGPQVEGGNYIWYPIFYDIDTQLGVNNAGVPYWDYEVEATASNTFSTPNSVLWNNMYKIMMPQIKNRYEKLRGNLLTISKLNGYYNFDYDVSKSYAMHGARPIIIPNVDEYYKYIDCAIGNGYTNTNNDIVTTTTYFYCLQGTRELQRALFLRNRFNYVDSMWQCGDYSITGSQQGIRMRYNANNIASTSDKYLDSNIASSFLTLAYDAAEPLKYADFSYEPNKYYYLTGANSEEFTSYTLDTASTATDGRNYYASTGFVQSTYLENPLDTCMDIKITPFLKQYVHAQYDDAMTSLVKANDGETVTIPTLATALNAIKSIPNAQQQILIIPGPAYVSSLGDLSVKYIDEFAIASAKRLKDLYLGNDTVGYKNLLMNNSSFKPDDSAKDAYGNTNPNAKTLLETVVLSNLSGLTGTLDFSGSEKLRTFRALGTGLASVTLADGVQIETLYLPQTVTTLILKEPTELTQLLTTRPVADSEGKYPKGLYIEGLTTQIDDYTNAKTFIDTINIVGGNMGYNSYIITEQAMKIKKAMQANAALESNYSKRLAINLENVDWTPYRLVESGEVYDASATYVQKTDHYTFEPYTFVSEENWDRGTLNSRIYQYDADKAANINVITNLDMLDDLIASYLSADNFFYSTQQIATGKRVNTLPYITGNVFINNDASNPISESKLQNYYKNNTTVKVSPIYDAGGNLHGYQVDENGEYFSTFPLLNIFVANAKIAYVTKYIDVQTTGIETEVDIIKIEPDGSGTQHAQMTTVTPTRMNYDFIGWATEAPEYRDGKPYINNKIVTEDDCVTAEQMNEMLFDSMKTTITFYAVYTIHSWTVKFLNRDTDLTVIHTINVQHGKTIPESEYKSLYPSLDDSDLELTEVYAFLGFANSLDKAKEGKVDDISKDEITSDREYYASYTKKSVYDNVLDAKWIYIEPNGKIRLADSADPSKLNGKITLPSMVNGITVAGISSTGSSSVAFQNMTHVTHIFWSNKNIMVDFVEMAPYSFAGCTQLRYFEMPPRVTKLGMFAFSRDERLFVQMKPKDGTGLPMNSYLDQFFANITDYGDSSMYMAKVNWNAPIIDENSYQDDGLILRINGNVTNLGKAAFANSGFWTVELGDINTPLKAVPTYVGNQSMFSKLRARPASFHIYVTAALSQTDEFKAFVSSGLNTIETPSEIIITTV